MVAQNQHYVPQFILRQFLKDKKREIVSVYDKHEDRIFTPSIKGIMSERSFHDFNLGDQYFSFEPSAGEAENIILPVYRKVLERRRLDGSAEEREGLAFLLAFQFLRAKAHRQRWADLQTAIEQKVTSLGYQGDKNERSENDENAVKRDHILSLHNTILEFTKIIAGKDFLLAESPQGRGFYLGDNPVALTNTRQFGPYGNIGLAVPGIEIYLPLSGDLQLCAWCPSILAEIRATLKQGGAERRREGFEAVKAGKITIQQLSNINKIMASIENPARELLEKVDDGVPISSSPENMDYYNSIQTQSAHRYVICQNGDFELAQRHNREFPKYRFGHRISVD